MKVFTALEKRHGRYKSFYIIRDIFIFKAVYRKIKYLATRISSTHEQVMNILPKNILFTS